jgi:hypothetical protein
MPATTAPPFSPVRLVLAADPFAPQRSRRRVVEIPWRPDLDVAATLELEGWPSDEHVWVNWRGRRYDPEEWNQIRLQPGDVLTAVHDPLGIEAALIAIGLSAFLAGAIAFVVNIGLAIGLSLLAAKLIGKPDAAQADDSPTYSFGAIQNLTRDGTPIPVVYGPHRVGGQLLQVIPDKNEEDNDTLRVLIGLCEGPIQSIAGLTTDANDLSGTTLPAGININGNAAEEMQGVSVWTRLGAREQDPIPGFEEQVNLVEVNLPLESFDAVEQTTTIPVDSFKIIILHPEGLYRTKKRSGKIKSNEAQYQVRWRRTGDSTWQETETVSLIRKKTSPFTSIYRSDGPNRVFGTPTQIDIEIKNLKPPSDARHKQDITWQQTLEATQEQALGYPNIAILALNIEASEAISGELPRVTTLMQGKKVWKWDRTDDNPLTNDGSFGYTVNPAEALYDWLVNQRYGGGHVFTKCDIGFESFSAWANYCEEQIDRLRGDGQNYNRWEIAIVIDTLQSFWDVVQQICAAGRAKPFLAGNIVKVIIERETDPVALIASGNLEADSWTLQYISPEDLPNWVEVQILDAENSYEHATVSLENPALITDPTVPVRKETMQFRGITDYGRAARAAQYMLNVATYQTRALELVGALDTIILEPGDVFMFARSVPSDLAISGRVTAAGTATVTLDEDLTIVEGEEWGVFVWTDGGSAETIQQRRIVEEAGTYPAGTALDLLTDWDSGDTPDAGNVYIARETLNVEQRHSLWRALAVDLTRDLKRRVSALAYDARVYDDVPPFLVDNQAEDRPTRGKIPPNPTNLLLREAGTPGSPSIAVSWVPATWPFRYPFRVYMRDVTEGDTTLGLELETFESFAELVDLDIGHQYFVAVVPGSATGGAWRRPEDGIIGAITLTGDVGFPDDPTGLAGVQVGDLVNLTWTAIDGDDNDFAAYEIRRGMEWTLAELVAEITDPLVESTLVAEWADGDERFWVRTRAPTGRYSEGPPTVDLDLDTTATGRSKDATRDEVALAWPGTRVDVSVDTDGALILSATKTSGTYETPTVDRGSVASRQIELNMQGEQLDDERTWYSQALTCDEATFTWDSDEAYQSWDDSDLRWEAPLAGRISWAGDLTLVPTTATIEVAVSDAGTPTDFTPLTQGEVRSFRYLRYKLTLTRDDATNRRVRITDADLTISS